jgi:hypothetical protein
MSISESRVEKTSSGRDLEMSPPFLEISKYDPGKADAGTKADPSSHTHTVRLTFFRRRRHYTSQLVLILLDGLHSLAGIQQGLHASSSAPWELIGRLLLQLSIHHAHGVGQFLKLLKFLPQTGRCWYST